MALTVMGGGGGGRGTRRKSILLNILLKKVVRCHGITLQYRENELAYGATNWPHRAMQNQYFVFFFSSARLLKKRPYAIDKMHRSLRVAIPSPPPPPPAKVKRKRRNVYENPNRTLLIVFCDDTINYAILCHLMIFFSSVKGNG